MQQANWSEDEPISNVVNVLDLNQKESVFKARRGESE